MSLNSKNNQQTEAELLAQLREILFKEETNKLNELQKVVEVKGLLSEKVSPIIEEKIEEMKDNFPKQFGRVIEREIEKKLASSHEEIIMVLTPHFGRLIRKFVGHQIEQLRADLERKFSFFNLIKARITGKKYADQLITESPDIELLEVMMIEKESGILLGQYSRTKTIDRDVVAGMLTAIKGFVEDAFGAANQELENIEYDSYLINIHQMPKFYFAFVLEGKMTPIYEEDLQKKVEGFFDTVFDGGVEDLRNNNFDEMSKALAFSFA